MAAFDVNAETSALRRKSPFGSRVVLIAEILGSVVVALLLLAIFFAEDTPNAPRWAIVALCAVGILIAAAFMFAFYYRAKILIDRGVIVQAKLEGSTQVRQTYGSSSRQTMMAKTFSFQSTFRRGWRVKYRQ